MQQHSRIFVAGHRGLVGSAIVRRLQADGFDNLLLRGRDQLDLTDRAAVDAFFAAEKPDVVILAAAKVGGIHANNSYPAEFLHDNLLLQDNVIDAAYRNGVQKLTFLGSSCIYPKLAPQPIKEEYLLTGPLEPTNEWYAIAKIAGIKLCQAYRRQYGFNAISADADQPLRPRRQLRPAELARPARADPQVPRSQIARRQGRRDVGHRHSAPRVPARRRPRRCGRAPDRSPTKARRSSTSASARTSASASWPNW